MDEFQNAPINVNATLFAINIKLNAIIASLGGEQLERYNEIIETKKSEAHSSLGQLLAPEDIEEFVRLLD